MREFFPSTLCRPSWKVSAAVQSSYSVENPLDPNSGERNFTVDFISVILKTLKAESCSLQVGKFLIRNPIGDSFRKFSVTFKAPLRNLVQSSILVALQIVYCKPTIPVKRRLLEKLLFGTSRTRIRFLDRVANSRSFCYFTKK